MRKLFIVLDDDASTQRSIFRYAKAADLPIRLLQLFKLDDAFASLDDWLRTGSFVDIAAIFVDGRIGSNHLNTELFVQRIRFEMAERNARIVLVATASDERDRARLMRVGCSHECGKSDIGQMIERLAKAATD